MCLLLLRFCYFSPGREYSIPSPLQRLMAEMVDFFILFFIKATIIISIMHLSGIKWVYFISVNEGYKSSRSWWFQDLSFKSSLQETSPCCLRYSTYNYLISVRSGGEGLFFFPSFKKIELLLKNHGYTGKKNLEKLSRNMETPFWETNGHLIRNTETRFGLKSQR